MRFFGRQRYPAGRVLFVGQCYYNFWYLSRELRKLEWRADLLDMDKGENNQSYYHGSDYRFSYRTLRDFLYQIYFYCRCFWAYDVFHFANAEGMNFGPLLNEIFKRFGTGSEVRLLKLFGKKIVYTNNGCRDGVTQSSFRKWGPSPVCDVCVWQKQPMVCSDRKNAQWGALRNSLADYQCLLGGNRADFNIAPGIHEAPWTYCLDKNFWSPDLLIPANFWLPLPKDTVKIYHAVGNFQSRSEASSAKNIKSTDVYLRVIEQLKSEGYPVELIFFHDVPNRQLRYYQAQADIVVDMLSFGFFGANVREAMMLGKPVICFLRPEWLESMRTEIPAYVEELPVISATPGTVYEELKRLVMDKARREAVGRRSREFAVKWHASDVAAEKFAQIYRGLRGSDLAKEEVVG
ncbi:GT4_WbuB-like domain containing protein [Comamonadaceae bacterium]